MSISTAFIRCVVYSSLSFICIFGAWVVHRSAQDANWLSRQYYPIEALLSTGNENCYGPQLALTRNIVNTARQQGSLSSQVVYQAPNGIISACASAAYHQPPNQEKHYRYASLTKLFTAQAVLNAMEQNDLSLHTPLSHFVTQITKAEDKRWAQVTIEQLLSHRAGLDRLRSPDPMTLHAVAPWCPNNLDRLPKISLDFDPGSEHGYSNLSYCLLGVVLEKLTKNSYRNEIKQQFDLQRYGINFIDGPYLNNEVSYDFRHTGFYSENYYRYLDFNALSSSAGLSGTANALVSWLADQRKKGQLTVTETVLSENCDFTIKRNCYNFSLFTYNKKQKKLIVQVQQGYLFGSPSTLLLDDQGGILLWLGNGAAPKGSASDNMLDAMYDQLAALYKNQ